MVAVGVFEHTHGETVLRGEHGVEGQTFCKLFHKIGSGMDLRRATADIVLPDRKTGLAQDIPITVALAFSRVARLTWALPLMTRETVVMETPACSEIP